MEKETNLAESLAMLNGLEHYSVNEMAVISAIRDGNKDVTSITEATAIPDTVVENIIKSLSNNQVISINEDGSVDLKNSTSTNKKLTFKGCMLLPVTSFHDANGKRWVCRGKWYEIPEDLNILEDIVWIDSVDEDEEMKSILKQISSTQQKRNAKAAKNVLKDDEPATEEDLQYLNSWVPAGSNVKMYVYAISASYAKVGFSPRFINDSGNEFPFGMEEPLEIIPIDQFHKMKSGEYETENGSYNFTAEKLLNIDSKKNLFVSWNSETSAAFIEFKYKKDGTISAIHMNVDAMTKSVSKSGEKNVITQDQVIDYVKTHAPETAKFLGL